jgi:hypothetical protein
MVLARLPPSTPGTSVQARGGGHKFGGASSAQHVTSPHRREDGFNAMRPDLRRQKTIRPGGCGQLSSS